MENGRAKQEKSLCACALCIFIWCGTKHHRNAHSTKKENSRGQKSKRGRTSKPSQQHSFRSTNLNWLLTDLHTNNFFIKHTSFNIEIFSMRWQNAPSPTTPCPTSRSLAPPWNYNFLLVFFSFRLFASIHTCVLSTNNFKVWFKFFV